MADSLRLRILKQITKELETIGSGTGPAGAYGTSLSGKVYRGRPSFGSSDPSTMLSVMEAPLPVERPSKRPGQAKTVDIAPWDLLVQGWTPDDAQNPTDPSYALAQAVQFILNRQVENKTKKGEPLFGIKEISEISIGRPVVRPPDEISSKAYFWLGLSLVFIEDGLDGVHDMS